MGKFSPSGVEGGVADQSPPLFTAEFDLGRALDQAQAAYRNRDEPVMWPFAEVHTIFICGRPAQLAFRDYLESVAAVTGCAPSPRLMRLYAAGQLDFEGVPVRFSEVGQGYMIVEHRPQPYPG